MRTTFRTSEGPDAVAPEPPTVHVDETEGDYFGCWSCGNPSLVRMSADGQDGILVATNDDEQGNWPFRSVNSVGGGNTIKWTDAPSGHHRLRVFRVDLAGNTSPVSHVEVDIPDSSSGCTTTGKAPVVDAVLIGFSVLLGSRRRARRGAATNTPS